MPRKEIQPKSSKEVKTKKGNLHPILSRGTSRHSNGKIMDMGVDIKDIPDVSAETIESLLEDYRNTKGFPEKNARHRRKS